jgi:hypothetical protein
MERLKVFTGRPGDPSKCQRCGARTRRGTACKRPAERNPTTGTRSRCRLHGGLSSGPKTAEGRARIAAAHLRDGKRTKAAIAARRELRARLLSMQEQTKATAAQLAASDNLQLSQLRKAQEKTR